MGKYIYVPEDLRPEVSGFNKRVDEIYDLNTYQVCVGSIITAKVDKCLKKDEDKYYYGWELGTATDWYHPCPETEYGDEGCTITIDDALIKNHGLYVYDDTYEYDMINNTKKQKNGYEDYNQLSFEGVDACQCEIGEVTDPNACPEETVAKERTQFCYQCLSDKCSGSAQKECPSGYIKQTAGKTAAGSQCYYCVSDDMCKVNFGDDYSAYPHPSYVARTPWGYFENKPLYLVGGGGCYIFKRIPNGGECWAEENCPARIKLSQSSGRWEVSTSLREYRTGNIIDSIYSNGNAPNPSDKFYDPTCFKVRLFIVSTNETVNVPCKNYGNSSSLGAYSPYFYIDCTDLDGNQTLYEKYEYDDGDFNQIGVQTGLGRCAPEYEVETEICPSYGEYCYIRFETR